MDVDTREDAILITDAFTFKTLVRSSWILKEFVAHNVMI